MAVFFETKDRAPSVLQVTSAVVVLPTATVLSFAVMTVAAAFWVRVITLLVVSPITVKEAVRSAVLLVFTSKVTSMDLPSSLLAKEAIHSSWLRTLQFLFAVTGMLADVASASTVRSATTSTSSVGAASSL